MVAAIGLPGSGDEESQMLARRGVEHHLQREHSRKPEDVRERIERLVAGPYPDHPPSAPAAPHP
jgi:N6-adenosine-specific RNA methylase IME4